MKKLIWLFILAAIGIGAWYAYTQYNKKAPTAADLDAEFKFTADAFVEAFNGYPSEEDAMKAFNGKVIEVSGEVEEVSQNGETVDILISSSDPLMGINVNLIPEMKEKAINIEPGATVKIKGFCTGKLSDIELNRGVIIE